MLTIQEGHEGLQSQHPDLYPYFFDYCGALNPHGEIAVENLSLAAENLLLKKERDSLDEKIAELEETIRIYEAAALEITAQGCY